MYKIIGADGKEYGPVTVEQLRQWIAEGRANAQSRVQAEGSAEWGPLGSLPDFAELFDTPVPPPAFSPMDVAAHDYTVDIGGSLGRSWELLKNNMGILIGTSLIYGLIMVALGLIGLIPFVNILSNIGQVIVGGPLLGGLYWVFLRLIRAQTAEIGDVFAGFKRAFGNLILVQLVSGIFAFLSVIPGAVLLGAGVAMMAGAKHNHSAMQAPGIALLVLGGLLLLAGLCVAVYLINCWVFAVPLVVDKRMGFWDAMKLSRAVVRKHWWGVFGFMFVVGLVGMAGLLACGVGVLFTGPLSMGAIALFYEDVLGTPAAPTT